MTGSLRASNGEENCTPFSLSIQPLTASAPLSYGERDYAAKMRQTVVKQEKGSEVSVDEGEWRNLAEVTENPRQFVK